MQQVQHPAIMTPNRMMVERDGEGVIRKLMLSFDLMGLSLREAIFRKDTPLQTSCIRGYMCDLLGALAFLHSRGIVRR